MMEEANGGFKMGVEETEHLESGGGYVAVRASFFLFGSHSVKGH